MKEKSLLEEEEDSMIDGDQQHFLCFLFFFSLKSVLDWDCLPGEENILNLQDSAATSATLL